jgi:hypothetical protein
VLVSGGSASAGHGLLVGPDRRRFGMSRRWPWSLTDVWVRVSGGRGSRTGAARLEERVLGPMSDAERSAAVTLSRTYSLGGGPGSSGPTDDMRLGLHDPRAEARRTEAVLDPSAVGDVYEAAAQRRRGQPRSRTR